MLSPLCPCVLLLVLTAPLLFSFPAWVVCCCCCQVCCGCSRVFHTCAQLWSSQQMRRKVPKKEVGGYQRWGLQSVRRFAACLRGGGRGKFSDGSRTRFQSVLEEKRWQLPPIWKEPRVQEGFWVLKGDSRSVTLPANLNHSSVSWMQRQSTPVFAVHVLSMNSSQTTNYAICRTGVYQFVEQGRTSLLALACKW